MSQPNTSNSEPLRVLCVDDESNILRAIKRMAHRQPYELITASSGAEALEIMAQKTINLIVSDMKMPQMSGPELLQAVAEQYPDTYRIVLSGYSDMEAAIKAVNKGKIHRFLQKPWQNQELLEAIAEGLQGMLIARENTLLQQKVAAQNQQLKELNESLEEKVQLRTKQIQLAVRKLQHHSLAMEKVLYNVLGTHPKMSGEFANNVARLAKGIALQMQLEPAQVKLVGRAGLLCELGLLGLDDELYSRPFNTLNYEQQRAFMQQTENIALIMGPATELKELVSVLEQQFAQFDGREDTCPLLGNEISIGARVLAVARDYWRYACKRMTDQAMDKDQCLREIRKYQGVKYDPEVVEALFSVRSGLTTNDKRQGITTAQLKPGMVLKENLFSVTHILLLPDGHVFTEETINKLMHFEAGQDHPLLLEVA